MILGINGIISVSRGDSDAQAFITAANITDTTQKNAISQLVIDLKSANLWTKMKAIYPFVGGTASPHRFNLKAPTTSASDFYLTFNGGVTHSINGVQFDGATGYADTNLIPNNVFNTTDLAAAGYYSRTSVASVPRDYVLGSYTVGRGSIGMVIKRTNDNLYTSATIDFPSGTSYRGVELSPNPYLASGLYHMSQQGTSFKYFRNTTLIAQNIFTTANLNLPTHPIYIGALNNNNVAGDHTNKQCAFAYFSDKLSDTDIANMYNAVQTFNTTLGRQV